MECYLSTKKGEIMLCAAKWIELGITMLSKISQAQKGEYHIFTHIAM
jgi:hypothetical protein